MALSYTYWLAIIAGSSDEVGNRVKVDSNGNIYAVGWSYSQGAGNRDIFVSKFDKFGNIEWQKLIGSAVSDRGVGIDLDSTNNIYVAGTSVNTIDGKQGIVIVKLNSTGAILWRRALGSVEYDYGSDIAVGQSNKIYVVGYTSGLNAIESAYSGVIAQYDTAGVLQWKKSFNFGTLTYPYQVVVDSSNNAYVAGYSRAGSIIRMILVKFDSTGAIVWFRSFDNIYASITSIAIDSSSNIYVGGTFTGIPGITASIPGTGLLVKFDNAGTLVWSKTITGVTVKGVAVDPSNKLYVSGIGDDAGITKAVISQYDSTTGGSLWQRILSVDNASLGITAGADGVYATGGLFNGLSTDLTITKVATNGTVDGSSGGNGIAGTISYTVPTFVTNAVTTITASSQSNINVADNEFTYLADVDATAILPAVQTGSLSVAVFPFVLLTTTTTSTTTTTPVPTTTTTTTPVPTTTTTTRRPGAPFYWVTTLGGLTDDRGYGIAVDAAGNSYVVGYTTSEGAGSYDVIIAKYGDTGDLYWQRTFGTTDSNFGAGIAVDPAGNVYVVGNTPIGLVPERDLVIAKYDTYGASQWQRTLGRLASEFGTGIAVDATGNAYVVGYTNSIGVGGYDLLIVKYDTAGVLQRQTTLGGTGIDRGAGIALGPGGQVFVVAGITSQGQGFDELLIAKYDNLGVLDWQRTLGSVSNEYGLGVATDPAGNVYVTGVANNQVGDSGNLLIAKYDNYGVLKWQKTLSGTGTEQGSGITVDSSGNIYVGGYTTSQGAGGYDLLIASYNTEGALQWQRTLGGVGDDYGMGIKTDPLGDLYVVGFTNSLGAGDYDLLVAKLPSTGLLTNNYPNFTYAVSNLTAATGTLIDAPAGLIGLVANLIDAPAILTNKISTLTSSTTVLNPFVTTSAPSAPITKTITIKNTGTENVTVQSIVFYDPPGISHSADLTSLGGSGFANGNAALSYVIGAGQSQNFIVTYIDSGAGPGTYAGTIVIEGSGATRVVINTTIIVLPIPTTTPAPTTTTTTSPPGVTTTPSPIIITTTTTTSAPITTTPAPYVYALTRNKDLMDNNSTVSFTLTTNDPRTFTYVISGVTAAELTGSLSAATGSISNGTTLTFRVSINDATGFPSPRSIILFINGISTAIPEIQLYGQNYIGVDVSPIYSWGVSMNGVAVAPGYNIYPFGTGLTGGNGFNNGNPLTITARNASSVAATSYVITAQGSGTATTISGVTYPAQNLSITSGGVLSGTGGLNGAVVIRATFFNGRTTSQAVTWTGAFNAL
jgi:uncharacterized delta-60 repeat protein